MKRNAWHPAPNDNRKVEFFPIKSCFAFVFSYINFLSFMNIFYPLNVYFSFSHIPTSFFSCICYASSYIYFPFPCISVIFLVYFTFSYINFVFLLYYLIFSARWHDDNAGKLPIGESSRSSVVLGSKESFKSQ